jgi:hypothetical protein
MKKSWLIIKAGLMLNVNLLFANDLGAGQKPAGANVAPAILVHVLEERPHDTPVVPVAAFLGVTASAVTASEKATLDSIVEIDDEFSLIFSDDESESSSDDKNDE